MHFAAAALVEKLKHNRTLSTDKTASEFVPAVLPPSLPLTYYPVEPHSAQGKLGTVWPASSPFLAAHQDWWQTFNPSSTLPSPSFLASPSAKQLPSTNRKKTPKIKLGTRTSKLETESILE